MLQRLSCVMPNGVDGNVWPLTLRPITFTDSKNFLESIFCGRHSDTCRRWPIVSLAPANSWSVCVFAQRICRVRHNDVNAIAHPAFPSWLAFTRLLTISTTHPARSPNEIALPSSFMSPNIARIGVYSDHFVAVSSKV